MIKKTDQVREALKAGDLKKALKIAKGFRLNITADERDRMARAYECIVHPDFYEQIGTNTLKAIAEGEEVVIRLYGA